MIKKQIDFTMLPQRTYSNIIILFVLIFSLVLIFNSCKEKESEFDTQSEDEAIEALKKETFNFPKTSIGLSPQARERAEEWSLYIAMESEVNRMKEYTIRDVMANSYTILKAADTLQKTIPKKFRQVPIESRIQVLHAKASVLHQLSEKQIPNIEKIKQTAEEIPVDFYNLNIQMNEIFIETPSFE